MEFLNGGGNMDILITYLGIINVLTLFISYSDKRAAINHRRRVPEKNLFIIALIGGSIGLYLSMLIFRHKTKHASFMIGVPAIIAVQLYLLWFFL